MFIKFYNLKDSKQQNITYFANLGEIQTKKKFGKSEQMKIRLNEIKKKKKSC
jgi:hypothetical protein